MFEANPKVGNVRNNGPELMRAAKAADENLPFPGCRGKAMALALSFAIQR